MEDGFRTWDQVEIECAFSDFKRIFPETVVARSGTGIVCQMHVGICVFNGYKKTRVGITRIADNGAAIAWILAAGLLALSFAVTGLSNSVVNNNINILFGLYPHCYINRSPMMGPMTNKA